MIFFLLLSTYLTSFISGVFGMAGGVILMGVYSFLFPISMAMVLHGIAQTLSNGFRAWLSWRHIEWSILPPYLLGSLITIGICFCIAIVPSKSFVFLLLGVLSVGSVFLPHGSPLAIEKPKISFLCGVSVTFMQVFSGVSGPLLDIFYLNGKLTRHQVIANKALTQTLGHSLKLIYYASFLTLSLRENFTLPYWMIPCIVGVTFLGALSGGIILKFLNDAQFRRISKYLIFIMGVLYLYKGAEETGYLKKAARYMKTDPLFVFNK